MLDNETKSQKLCKFYLSDSCAKGENCEFMHSEFPCKYYYLGLKCENQVNDRACKLKHGGVLSNEMVSALSLHISKAPLNVLGQAFYSLRSKLNQTKITQMLDDFQEKLKTANSTDATSSDKKSYIALEKLTCATHNQVVRLKEKNVFNIDQVLDMTLRELHAIGIRSQQIEEIFSLLEDEQFTNTMNCIQQPLMSTDSNIEKSTRNDFGATDSDEIEEYPLMIDEWNYENNEVAEKETVRYI